MDAVNKQGGDLDLSGVIDLARGIGGLGNVGAGEIIDAGYSQKAEQARASGGATMAMMESRLGSIRDDRGNYLSQVLSKTQLASLNGNFSIENIERQLRPGSLSKSIRDAWTAQAERYGYTSAENMDAALQSTRLAAQMREAMGNVSDMQLDMQGHGRVRGAIGFLNMVSKLGEGNVSVGKVIESLIGGDPKAIQAAVLNRSGLLNKANIQAIVEGGSDNLLGLDVAVQALETGQIGGKQISDADLAEVRELFTTEDVSRRDKLLTKFSAMADPGRKMQLEAERETTDMMKNKNKFYTQEDLKGMSAEKREEALATMAKARAEYADEGKLVAQLKEYERLADPSNGADVIMSGGKQAQFQAAAKEYSKILQSTTDVEEAKKKFLSDPSSKADRQEFLNNFEANTNIQTSMGASAESSAMGRIVMLLQGLFDKITRDGVKTDGSSKEQMVKKEGKE